MKTSGRKGCRVWEGAMGLFVFHVSARVAKSPFLKPLKVCDFSKCYLKSLSSTCLLVTVALLCAVQNLDV